ncbi:ATP-dependent Clp protease ATP-binding subunit, partial [Candidatus Gribaldobacteria bacterium]|nr:ATP-dependent Clp protease ATP-binding subunit [Candidatus Gribaldobacteria bacterium]
ISLFLIFGLFLLSLIVFNFQNKALEKQKIVLLYAGFAFYFVFLIWYFELNLFFNSFLKKPKNKTDLKKALEEPERYNLADFFDFVASQILVDSLKKQQKRSLITIENQLLICLLKKKLEVIKFIFLRSQLNKDELLKRIKQNSSQEKSFWQEIVLTALQSAFNNQRELAGVGDLFFAFSRVLPIFKQFLLENDFTSDDILNLVHWHLTLRARKIKNKQWWLRENLSQRGSVARDWVSSYTIFLDKFGLDLREKIRQGEIKEIIGHNQELMLAERVLANQVKGNLLLVGETGVGKFALVKKIAQRAFSGSSNSVLNYQRIIDLDLSVLLAASLNKNETETLFDTCFKEALQAGNVILCLRNIDNFLIDQSGLGALDISSLLARYLSYPGFKVIALTTFDGLHNILEQKSALLSQFEKVEVKEISQQETLFILEDLTDFFEKRYKKLILFQALKTIINLSSRYFNSLPFPGKAIRLLDEAMSYLVLHTKDKCLKVKHLKKVIAEKTGLPLEDIEEKERFLLLNLENEIHKNLINQAMAVSEVASALRRTRSEISQKQGPIGSFLFLGPTGVGKTELAKTLSKIYFTDEKKMLRFDMSEFQTSDDLKRLIGFGKTPGILALKVKENPFALLLLDELEKCHQDILNLFLQILDDGFFTDGQGRRVNFSNTIIIATSNAGSALIRERIKQGKTAQELKQELIDYLIKERIYRPELLNRFDSIVFFEPLGKKELLQIAQIMLSSLAKNLLDKGIIFEISLPLKEKIVELSYNPEFGAREMKRVIQDKVENVLSVALLEG